MNEINDVGFAMVMAMLIIRLLIIRLSKVRISVCLHGYLRFVN